MTRTSFAVVCTTFGVQLSCVALGHALGGWEWVGALVAGLLIGVAILTIVGAL